MTTTMLLAIDVGSSSVKAAVLDGTAVVGEVVSSPYETDHDDDRSEVPVGRIEAAIRIAAGRLDASKASAIGLTGMGPAWLAMDEKGNALTPVVTHADRRSLEQAKRIEAAVGRERHLMLAGNRPTPGGISSTTAAWFAQETDVLNHAAVLGHLPTYLLHQLTGEWTIDPSNAGFTGLMDVSTLDWSEELCAAAGVAREKLPPIRDAAEVAGESGENDLGLPPGLPVVGGYVDGGGPILLAGPRPGVLVHSAGSTDVLALCTDRPMPREGLLCRPLGTKGLWVSAATLSSGGSAIAWVRRMLFEAESNADFDAECQAALARPDTGVRFDPHLAGDRQSVDQPTGGFSGLTLATDRLDLLRAVLDALAESSAERMNRLLALGMAVEREVVLTGGLDFLGEVLHRDWPGADWRFRAEEEATLRGLGGL